MEREEFAELMSSLASALIELDSRTAPAHAERPTAPIKAAVEALNKAAEDARPASAAPREPAPAAEPPKEPE